MESFWEKVEQTAANRAGRPGEGGVGVGFCENGMRRVLCAHSHHITHIHTYSVYIESWGGGGARGMREAAVVVAVPL